MRYSLQKTIFAVIAALIPFGVLRAEITTVILPENPPGMLKISAEKADSVHTEQLTFQINPPPIASAQVLQCVLRVVPTPQSGPERRDQTVSVLWNDEPAPIGFWKAFSKTTQPYAAQLDKKACATGKTRLTLKTQSEFTSWDYYGSGAPTRAGLPRLIVTYDSPAPAQSGNLTDWAYSQPASFFSSQLSSAAMLTNPVSWDGKVYYIAGGKIYQVVGAGNVLSWDLSPKFGNTEVAVSIDAKSLAFVTAWGRLRVLTTGAIYSCDLKILRSLNSGDKLPCNTTAPGEGIKINADETPAMGPDSSLYFKNVDAAEGNVKAVGSVVAYNASLQKIWESSLKFEKVSPIALNSNGRYAYVLAVIPVQGAAHFALLRIDTATGDTVEDEISYGPGPQDKQIKPELAELRKPAVVSKVVNGSSVDYVLAAGNTNDKGVLQLVAFAPGARCMWSQLGEPGLETIFNCDANPVKGKDPTKRLGKITAAPVPSLDGNYAFVAWQDGTVYRYAWFNTAAGQEGAFAATNLKPEELEGKKVAGVSELLVDRGGSVYLDASNSLSVYDAGSKKIINTGVALSSKTLEFTTGGTLIGYSDKGIFNYSPKSNGTISPPVLANSTIYSADSVTVPGNPGVQTGQQVILKGNSISFPPTNFQWPAGATLQVLSIPK